MCPKQRLKTRKIRVLNGCLHLMSWPSVFPQASTDNPGVSLGQARWLAIRGLFSVVRPCSRWWWPASPAGQGPGGCAEPRSACRSRPSFRRAGVRVILAPRSRSSHVKVRGYVLSLLPRRIQRGKKSAMKQGLVKNSNLRYRLTLEVGQRTPRTRSAWTTGTRGDSRQCTAKDAPTHRSSREELSEGTRPSRKMSWQKFAFIGNTFRKARRTSPSCRRAGHSPVLSRCGLQRTQFP